MSTRDVTLIGKPGCHLCDDARDALGQVVAALPPEAPAVRVTERSILDDSELRERFADEIPVILIDGRVHTYWRIDPARLRSALLEVR